MHQIEKKALSLISNQKYAELNKFLPKIKPINLILWYDCQILLAHLDRDVGLANELLDARLDIHSDNMPYDNLCLFAEIRSNGFRYREATLLIQKAMPLSNGDMRAPELLFWVSMRQGLFDQASHTIELIQMQMPHEAKYSLYRLVLANAEGNQQAVIDNWLASKDEICSLEPSDLGAKVSYTIIVAYCFFGRYKEAEEIIQFWTKDYGADQWFQMACSLLAKSQGLFSDSIACYEKIIEQAPDFIEAKWNRALTLLAAGRTREGFEAHEVRWEWDEFESPYLAPGIVAWDGSSNLDGRRLLLWGEQGIGDQIMFLSLLGSLLTKYPLVSVTIEVEKKLVPLIQAWYPECTVREFCDPKLLESRKEECFDYQLALGSLGRFFDPLDPAVNESVRTFSAPSKEQSDELLGQFGKMYKVLIGIGWRSGNTKAKRRHQYFNVEGVKSIISSCPDDLGFVSLQYGITNEERDALSELGNVFIPDDDFFDNVSLHAEYAALCDLVITPRTVLVYLGALSRVPVLMWADKYAWPWLGQSQWPWFQNILCIKCDNGWDVGALIANIKERLNILVPQLRALGKQK